MTEDHGKGSLSPEHWRRLIARRLTTAREAGTQIANWSRKSWQRVTALLQEWELVQAPSAPLPPPGRVVQHSAAPGTISVPAQGYVHAFKLRATFTWSSEGLPPETLIFYSRYFMPLAIERLTRLAAEHSRNVEPHAAKELEMTLQGLLRPWDYEPNGKTVTCHPHVRVELDARVKQALLSSWKRRVKLDQEQDLHLRQAQHARELSHQWVAILQALVDASAASEAGSAKKEALTSALQRMMARQQAAEEWIDELLSRRARDDDLHSGEDTSTAPGNPERPGHETPEPAV